MKMHSPALAKDWASIAIPRCFFRTRHLSTHCSPLQQKSATGAREVS
jgi:hypothetical protein